MAVKWPQHSPKVTYPTINHVMAAKVSSTGKCEKHKCLRIPRNSTFGMSLARVWLWREPNRKRKKGHLSVCSSVCPSVHLSICLSSEAPGSSLTFVGVFCCCFTLMCSLEGKQRKCDNSLIVLDSE